LVKSPLSAQPITAHLDGAARLLIQEAPTQQLPVEDPAEMDHLVIGSLSLAGRIEGTGQASLQWRATGALEPVEVQRGVGLFDIQRPEQEIDSMQASPAVFVLKGGHLLPGRLESVVDDGVKVSSPFSTITHLPNDVLRAICFRDLSRMRPRGFEDPAWQITKGTKEDVRLEQGKLTLKNRATYGHPNILAGDELRFTFNTPESYGAMAVEMYKDGTSPGSRGGTLHVMRSGTQFWCAVEHSDGQSRSSDYVGNVRPGPVSLHVLLRNGMLQVSANGVQLVNAAMPDERRKGQGMSFGASEMWGGSQSTTLQVSDFSIVTRADHLPAPIVDEKTREMALLLPRFRKDSPPQHLLLAPNGDLLRGRIQDFVGSALKFQSGVENATIPLERLQAAIWLQPATPDGTAPPAEAPAPVGENYYHVLLKDGGPWVFLKGDGSPDGEDQGNEAPSDETEGDGMIFYEPIPDEIRREWIQLMFDRLKMHYELRQRIRRSAGLPAGNLVTGSFRRPVRNNPRRPRS
jgi:hypothetical protein